MDADEFVSEAVSALADRAYATVAEDYAAAADAVEEPRDWATTPLFEAAAATTQQVARGPADGEVAIEWADLHGPDPADPGAFLARRATYKRSRFPALVERAVAGVRTAGPTTSTGWPRRCSACGVRRRPSGSEPGRRSHRRDPDQ